MDPATILAFTNVIALAVKTYQQYSQGTITAEQAQAMFASASDTLGNAIDAFERAVKPIKGDTAISI